MTAKNSRRVVIIDKVKSDIIDQAILILKSSDTQGVQISKTAPIVLQAQEIIDSYINKVEQLTIKTAKQQKRHLRLKHLRQLSISLTALIITVLAAFASGWLISVIL